MPFKCQLCDKRFKNSDSLNTHIINKHEKIKHHCESCNMLFRTSYGLHRHGLAQHTNTIGFKCELCDKTFTKRIFLNRHIRYVHNVCRYDCPICSKSFDNFTVCKIHKQDCKHPAVEEPKKSEECREQYNMCGICCKECDGQEGLTNHLQTHPVEDYVKETSGCFVCVLCPRYRRRTRNRLIAHVLCWHLHKMSLCNFCGKVYKKHNSLMRHIRHQHTHSDDIKFLCYVCSAVYKRKDRLLFHMQSHGIHHDCIVCKKTFMCPDDLHKHAITFHTAYSSYSCYICGKQSIQRHEFMNHMFEHTGKGIICTICFETFNEKDELECHKVNVHSKCAKCQTWLLNKECADLHFKMSHSNVSNNHILEEIKQTKKHRNSTSISNIHFMQMPKLRFGQLKVNRHSNNELQTRTVIGNEVVEEMEVNQHSINELDSPTCTYTGNESCTVIGNEVVMLGDSNTGNHILEDIKQNKKSTKRTRSTSISNMHFMQMSNLGSRFGQSKLETCTVIGNEIIEEMEVNQHSSNALDSPTYTGNESFTVIGNKVVMSGVNQDSNNHTLEEIEQNKKSIKRTNSTISKMNLMKMRKLRKKSISRFGQLMRMQCKNRPTSTYDSNGVVTVMHMVYKCDILSCGCYFNHRDFLILHILACHSQSHCGSIVLNIEHSYSKHQKPHKYFPFHTKHVSESVTDLNGHNYSKAWTSKSHESDIECETIKDNSGCLSAEFELIPLETFNRIIKHQISEHTCISI